MDIRFKASVYLSAQEQNELTNWATAHGSDNDLGFVLIGRDDIVVHGILGDAWAIAREPGHLSDALDRGLANMRAVG